MPWLFWVNLCSFIFIPDFNILIIDFICFSFKSPNVHSRLRFLFFGYRTAGFVLFLSVYGGPCLSIGLCALGLRRGPRACVTASRVLWSTTWSAARDTSWRTSPLWRPAPPTWAACMRHYFPCTVERNVERSAGYRLTYVATSTSRSAHCYRWTQRISIITWRQRRCLSWSAYWSAAWEVRWRQSWLWRSAHSLRIRRNSVPLWGQCIFTVTVLGGLEVFLYKTVVVMFDQVDVYLLAPPPEPFWDNFFDSPRWGHFICDPHVFILLANRKVNTSHDMSHDHIPSNIFMSKIYVYKVFPSVCLQHQF